MVIPFFTLEGDKMELRFYNMTDTKNTIGKKLTDYTSTFIKAKYQDLNITNPIFLLKFTEYPKYNYIHIPALKRYYFIDDIVVKTDNAFELVCSCDVLESFKDDILTGTGHLIKSESYNPYYGEFESADNKIIQRYYSDKEITTDSTDKVMIILGK